MALPDSDPPGFPGLGRRARASGHPGPVAPWRDRLGVANTHLDHVGTMARERSAALIADWLGQEPDRAWVVLGDLNDQPGSRPLRLLAEAGYIDALGPESGGTEHAFSGATDRTRIDYVLVGRDVQVRAAWISHSRPRGRLPSDHWPVLADLTVG
ncbi:MAG: endonuclease/exonuclease/phosphatase family protein [Jatrophihabitantaceae bacterium]